MIDETPAAAWRDGVKLLKLLDMTQPFNFRSAQEQGHKGGAAVQVSIEKWLDQLPTAYEAPLWEEKVQAVYSHIYDNYYGNGRSVYTQLAAAA